MILVQQPTHSFDRLGRSALHVFQTIAALEEKGVTVISLKEGAEQQFSGAAGKFMRDLLILVAELERSMNAERVAEARAAKAARAETGEQVAGRPVTAMTAENVKKVRKWREKGRSVAEIVKLTGISRASVYRALADWTPDAVSQTTAERAAAADASAPVPYRVERDDKGTVFYVSERSGRRYTSSRTLQLADRAG